MGCRYEITILTKPVEVAEGCGHGYVTVQRHHYTAVVWDKETGEEAGEFSGMDRQAVLRKAATRRAELEGRREGPVTPEQAMRFARVFLDLITSVNKSIDGFEIHYGYGISEGLEVRVFPLSNPEDNGVRLSRPVAVSVGPGQDVTDVLESALSLAKGGRS